MRNITLNVLFVYTTIVLCCYRYGPLRQHWTMRFEAKHSYFKRMSQNIGNFINLPYTLALRHQKLQCYHAMNQHNFSCGKVAAGPCHLVSSVVAPSELCTGSDIFRYNNMYM